MYICAYKELNYVMSKYHAPALDKGLDIIEHLSMMAVPLSQGEIAQGIDKGPNEIYRMLVCLEERGYLRKDAASGKFSLSLKLYQLSHRHSPVDGLLQTAKPLMEDLSNRIKQSCHLSILQNGRLMIIAQSKSPGPVSLSIEEGSIFPIVKTTSGRVLLAFSGEKQRNKILADDGDFTYMSEGEKKLFLERLAQINARGYELESSEITEGVTDLAVPVGSYETGIFSVLATSSLTSITENHKSGDLLIDQIKSTAARINQAIGI